MFRCGIFLMCFFPLKEMDIPFGFEVLFFRIPLIGFVLFEDGIVTVVVVVVAVLV